MRNLANKTQLKSGDVLKTLGIVARYIALVLCKIINNKSHDKQLQGSNKRTHKTIFMMFIKQWCIAYKNGSEFGKMSFDRKNLICSMDL
jgi:hypothetical protein